MQRFPFSAGEKAGKKLAKSSDRKKSLGLKFENPPKIKGVVVLVGTPSLAAWNPMSWRVSSRCDIVKTTRSSGLALCTAIGVLQPLGLWLGRPGLCKNYQSLNSSNHPYIHPSIFLNSLHISEWESLRCRIFLCIFLFLLVLKPATNPNSRSTRDQCICTDAGCSASDRCLPRCKDSKAYLSCPAVSVEQKGINLNRDH